MIFQLAIILNCVRAYILYKASRTYVISPTFHKMSRSLNLQQEITINISSEIIPFDMYMRIRKSESVLTPEFKYNYKHFERYLEIDEHLYDGKVEVIDKNTHTRIYQPIVVEKVGTKINALFTTKDEQYIIEPINKVSRAYSTSGNPHRLKIIYRDRNYTYNGLSDISQNITDFEWTHTNSSTLFHKRTDGQRYTIEATVHIPLFKISTPIRYILHIMAQVNQIFKYPSLDVDLTIKIANILVYPDNYVYDNYDMTLDKFFSYKKAYLEDMDLTILITNQLHRSTDSMPVTGFAGFRFMCIPYFSAMVVQDEGLFTANTIAHEVGHMLGAVHDMHTPCNVSESRGIMHYDSDLTQINMWSECSANDIHRFLKTPFVDCLRKQQDLLTLRELVTLPGYDLFDQQCSLTLPDPHASIISMNSNCSVVWCRRSNNAGTRLSFPPMEGTPCIYSDTFNKTILTPSKYGKLCFRGICSTTGQIAEKLNITWGPWQNWSACLRGHKMRTRICQAPERLMCQGGNRMAENCGYRRKPQAII